MKGKRDLWKEIENLPEGEQPKEHLLDDLLADVPAAKTVAADVLLLPAAPRAAGETVALARRRGGIVTAVFMGLVLLAIFFSIYFVTSSNMREEIRYFDTTQVTTETVSDMPAFVEENELKMRYYENGVNSTYSAFYTVENHELVYIKQGTIIISATGFDQVNLGIVLTNDEFEEFESFYLIQNETQIFEIPVLYESKKITNGYNIKARFAQDGVTYFLEIISPTDQGVLENYVSLLLGL